jgi:hypothetical protein
MNTLKGKVAIVTGASKGIGAAIARGLAAAGAAVAVNYSSGKDGADRTVAEITSNGGKAIAIQGNVGKATDVRRFFEETEKALGSPKRAGEQRRRLSVRALRGDHRKGIPSRIRHQCPGPVPDDSGSVEALPGQWRQHHKYQFDRQRESRTELVSLFGDQGCGRYPHDGAGQGTGATKHSGQHGGAGSHRH